MSMLDRLYHYDETRDPPLKRRAIWLARYLALLGQEFQRDNVVVRANALAYASLLALVPLTAVVFSMFTVFSAFGDMKEKIQAFLFDNMIPAKSGEIMTYMNQFTSNTNKLGAIGGAAMLVTTVMLLQNIEKNLNAVWQVKDRRKTVTKMMVFTAVLVWGTAFLGTSFYITGKVQALLIYQEIMEVGILSRLLWGLFPFALSTAAFAFVMKVVPAAKVKFRSALVGGVIGAGLFELGKKAFAHYASGAVSYSVIYGSLAMVPLFLVWLYLTWMIVMLAAEATFVHQNYRALIKSRVFGEMDSHKKMLLALQIYMFIAQRFHDAREAPGADDVAARTSVPVETAEEILEAFTANGLLKTVEEPEGGYVPARSPGTLPARELVHSVFRAASGEKTFRNVDLSDEVASLMLDQFEVGGYNAVGDADLETLLRASGSVGTR